SRSRPYRRAGNPRAIACVWWKIRAVVRAKLARNAGKQADDKTCPLASRRDVPRGGCAQDREYTTRIDIHLAAGEAPLARGARFTAWRLFVFSGNNLSKAGWSWGCVSAIDSSGRTIWIADAHRDDGKRFAVRADA